MRTYLRVRVIPNVCIIEFDVPGLDRQGAAVGHRVPGVGGEVEKNLLDLKRERWAGPESLAPGKHTLVFDFKYDGLGFATLAFNNLSGLGRGGTDLPGGGGIPV